MLQTTWIPLTTFATLPDIYLEIVCLRDKCCQVYIFAFISVDMKFDSGVGKINFETNVKEQQISKN